MADYGIKVSKSGESVYSTDPRDYNLWSKYQVLKIAASGGGTFVANAGNGGKLTVNHNLGYNPVVFWLSELTSTGTTGPDDGVRDIRGNAQDAFGWRYVVNATDDLNNVHVYHGTDGGAEATYDYFYYFFYDEGLNS